MRSMTRSGLGRAVVADLRGQANPREQRARLTPSHRSSDPAAESVRQAPGHREPRDDQRPSNATRDDVTDFVAEQAGEHVVAEFAVAVTVDDLPGDGDELAGCAEGKHSGG
jgi:hypothetical protein